MKREDLMSAGEAVAHIMKVEGISARTARRLLAKVIREQKWTIFDPDGDVLLAGIAADLIEPEGNDH